MLLTREVSPDREVEQRRKLPSAECPQEVGWPILSPQILTSVAWLQRMCVLMTVALENKFSKEQRRGLPGLLELPPWRSCWVLGEVAPAALQEAWLQWPCHPWALFLSGRQAREGRVNQKWSGAAPGQAASLQNRAAFVRRQVISRNTADTRPRAA